MKEGNSNMLLYMFMFIHTLYSIALHGTRPIISLFAYQSGASEALIGLLVSAFALLPMFFAIKVGKWLDDYGAQRITLIGGGGMLFAALIPALFPNLATLFFSQLMMGFSQICVLVSFQKTVGNLAGHRDKLIAAFSLTGSLGELIGPLMNGFAYEHFGFSATFGITSVFILIAISAGLCLSKDSWKSGASVSRIPSQHLGSTWGMLRQVNLRNALIISGLVLYSKDLFVAYFPIYASNLGISAGGIGMILSAMAAMSMIVRLVQFRLVQLFGRGRILFTTLIISGITYLFIPFSTLPIVLTGLAVLLGGGLGLGQPLSLVYAMNASPDGRQGEVLGMRLTFNRGSQFGAPFLFGGIGSLAGLSPIFWVSGGILLLGAFLTRMRSSEDKVDEVEKIVNQV
jgi:MFS family permease